MEVAFCLYEKCEKMSILHDIVEVGDCIRRAFLFYCVLFCSASCGVPSSKMHTKKDSTKD